MAYNQQQQPQQQQYIVAGQMLNMGDQVVQQQQYIAVDQHAMAAPIGKITLNEICYFLILYTYFRIAISINIATSSLTIFLML